MNPARDADPQRPATDKMDWYIYYRARTEHAAKLQQSVAAMQARLSKESGIAGALKRRPLPQDGRHTWMEVYTAVPHDFEMILAEAVAAAGLLAWIDGDRHTEIFADARLVAGTPPCA